MNLINIKGILIFLIVAILLTGCEQEPLKNYPDYSSPEATFNTQFYALQHKDYIVMFDVSGEEYQKTFGKNKEEQFLSFKKYAEKIKPNKKAHRIITKVEYGPFDGYDAKITWAEKVGSHYTIRKSYMLFRKVNNEWRLYFPESENKTVRKI